MQRSAALDISLVRVGLARRLRNSLTDVVLAGGGSILEWYSITVVLWISISSERKGQDDLDCVQVAVRRSPMERGFA